MRPLVAPHIDQGVTRPFFATMIYSRLRINPPVTGSYLWVGFTILFIRSGPPEFHTVRALDFDDLGFDAKELQAAA